MCWVSYFCRVLGDLVPLFGVGLVGVSCVVYLSSFSFMVVRVLSGVFFWVVSRNSA